MWVLIVWACGSGPGAGCAYLNRVPVFETQQECEVAQNIMSDSWAANWARCIKVKEIK